MKKIIDPDELEAVLMIKSEFWRTQDNDPHDINLAVSVALSEIADALKRYKQHKVSKIPSIQRLRIKLKAAERILGMYDSPFPDRQELKKRSEQEELVAELRAKLISAEREGGRCDEG